MDAALRLCRALGQGARGQEPGPVGERLVRVGCAMGNIRAEEASGAKDDRGGLLEQLDLVGSGDTLVVTHIGRLSRGLIYGLQVIEGLHHAGVEFRSYRKTSTRPQPTASSSSRWCSPSASGGGTPSGSARSRARPRRGPRAVSLDGDRSLPSNNGSTSGRTVEGSELAGTGQAPRGQPLDHPAGGRVGVGWRMHTPLESRE